MADAAGVPVGSEGLLFLPYLLGERTLGSADSRGVFFGLHPRHGRAHATRAILEGICFDLRQSLEIARESGLAVAEMRTGGGGARSALWSQIKADVYGIPISTLHHEEAGILGAAMLAGVGVGAYASEADAANRLVQTRERFTPTSMPPRVRPASMRSSMTCTTASSRAFSVQPTGQFMIGAANTRPGPIDRDGNKRGEKERVTDQRARAPC